MQIADKNKKEKLASIIEQHLRNIPHSYVHGALSEARKIVELVMSNKELLD